MLNKTDQELMKIISKESTEELNRRGLCPFTEYFYNENGTAIRPIIIKYTAEMESVMRRVALLNPKIFENALFIKISANKFDSNVYSRLTYSKFINHE